ncbi:MAG: lysine--tRNA ligase, partial [bacterium]|nr:lysine--tRNA ligase [bacterium]
MSDENIYIEQRRQKVAELRSKKIAPYPQNIKPSHTALGVLTPFEKETAEKLETLKETVSVAGRVLFIR